MALDCEARMDHLQGEPSVDGTHVNSRPSGVIYNNLTLKSHHCFVLNQVIDNCPYFKRQVRALGIHSIDANSLRAIARKDMYEAPSASSGITISFNI